MLCGVDLPKVDIILISRPFSLISSILQAAGRGGRLQMDGSRRKVLVYLLYNATYIRVNAKHIGKDVRSFCREGSCLKLILYKYYSSKDGKLIRNVEWCCNNH